MMYSGLKRGPDDRSETKTPKTEDHLSRPDIQRRHFVRRMVRAGVPAMATVLSLMPTPAHAGQQGRANGAKLAAYENQKKTLSDEYLAFLQTHKSEIPETLTNPFQVTDPESFLRYTSNDQACDPNSIMGKAIIKRKNKDQIEVSLERRARVASSAAILGLNEQGQATVKSPDTVMYGYDCPDLYSSQFSLQAWRLVRNKKKGAWQWSRHRSINSVKFPNWQPDLQQPMQDFTGQPNVSRWDTVSFRYPAKLSAMGIKLAFVAKQSATISPYSTKQAFMVGPRVPQRIGARKRIDVSVYDDENIISMTRIQ
jgi:hypothetical protein